MFNPEGLPNATSQTYTIKTANGILNTTIPIFDAPGRQQKNQDGKPIDSTLWTVKDAVGYLLVMGAADWAIDPASFNDAALTAAFPVNNNPVVSNINVEGKPLIEALRSLCEPLNVIFSIDPFWGVGATKHTIRFYFRGHGPAAPDLTLSARGTSAAAGKSNLIDFKVNEDSTPSSTTSRRMATEFNIPPWHTRTPQMPPYRFWCSGWDDAKLDAHHRGGAGLGT